MSKQRGAPCALACLAFVPAFTLGFLAMAALSFTGCATNAATGKQDLMLVSTEEETKRAGEEHQRFVSSPGLYSDKEFQDYEQVATHPELEERIEKVEIAAEVAQAQSTDLQAAYLEQTAELVFEAFYETNPTQNRKDIWLDREALFQIYLPPDWKIVES